MSTEGTSQPESPEKNTKLGNSSSAPGLLSATAAAGPYDKEDDDPILATLKRSPIKKRNPAQKWDGRVQGMTLQEYRDRKWSVDACYAKIERRGPAFSIRRQLPSYLDLGKKPTNFCVGDVVSALDKTLRSSASYSMGMNLGHMEPDHPGQGPAEYRIPSTMDPVPHPTCKGKNCGARFGAEVLQPRDPPGPAPGDYDPDAIDHSSTLKRQPKFTIQGRESWKPPTAPPGPGVGEYKIDKACPICTGSGKSPVPLACPKCNGKGKHEGKGCPRCKGRGRLDNLACDGCGGSGVLQGFRTGKMTPIHYTIQGKGEPPAEPLGQRQYESPGPASYKGPGAGGADHPMRRKAPIWKFGTEARGLRN